MSLSVIKSAIEDKRHWILLAEGDAGRGVLQEAALACSLAGMAPECTLVDYTNAASGQIGQVLVVLLEKQLLPGKELERLLNILHVDAPLGDGNDILMLAEDSSLLVDMLLSLDNDTVKEQSLAAN